MASRRAADAAPERRRTCVGCRKSAHPSELVRVARAPEGAVVIGPGPGRGAWLCGPPETAGCFEQALHRRAWGRALRTELTSPELEELRARLLNCGN